MINTNSLQKEEVEGKPLFISTLEEELAEYAAKNGYKRHGKSMCEMPKTQRNMAVPEQKKKKALPSMEVLKNLSQRLEAARDASVSARKGQKVCIR